ncbi:50S ribosomal protein L33 [Candidatus Gottesmanbacteria bacterium RIFCSPLOWO2_01_FULL_48_11]|uniref:Large ribosomal subunit protein bL33 n=2 Tax=Candidatus Gottesmaniibacteriota TaxID=1752720 RepID=A0A1F6ATC5_9BACT|nr:MAG: 50S ribosomal protein L33 [Candidatus Gottesmanbacteria bacterium RIFCSPLOWO2_01_FULL_48_11]
MAKKEQRELLAMICTVCKSQNYITKRNKINTPEKLVMRKYCRHCRKHTEHKESSKLD